jgi:hypothetical protein
MHQSMRWKLCIRPLWPLCLANSGPRATRPQRRLLRERKELRSSCKPLPLSHSIVLCGSGRSYLPTSLIGSVLHARLRPCFLVYPMISDHAALPLLLIASMQPQPQWLVNSSLSISCSHEGPVACERLAAEVHHRTASISGQDGQLHGGDSLPTSQYGLSTNDLDGYGEKDGATTLSVQCIFCRAFWGPFPF